MERIDLSRPGRRVELDPQLPADSTDVQRLARAFNRMLERLERERRRSGELVLQAQEEERKRVARDLHDEVNQALTALLLRLEAAAQHAPPELQDGARRDQAARQPGDGGAARPRAPAAADRARRPRPRRRRSRRTSASTTGAARRSAQLLGSTPTLERACRQRRRGRDLPGRPGGARRTRRATRARAASRSASSAHDSRVVLEVADDGSGFAFADEGKGLGLSGMRERALLVGRQARDRLAARADGHDACKAARCRRADERVEDPDRGRPRDRPLGREAAARPPARHGGRGRGRGRRRGGREGDRSSGPTSRSSTSRCRA